MPASSLGRLVLREMLRMHRGLSTIRRIKAIFWWCYVHTESPPREHHAA